MAQDSAAPVPEKVGKKVKRFCKWAFSRKSKKTTIGAQQSQCSQQPQRCSDGEAACVPPRPVPEKVGKKIKRFCRWAFSRKSKQTQQSQCSDGSSQQPQRCSDGEAEDAAACAPPRPAQDVTNVISSHSVNSIVLSLDKAEQNSDTSVNSWKSCMSSLTSVPEFDKDVPDSDNTSVNSWHSCVSSLTAAQDADQVIPGENQAAISVSPVRSDGPVSSATEENKNTESTPNDLAWKTEEEMIQLSLKGKTGDILQHYIIGNRLGQGSYGIVADGIRVSYSRKVAIKYVEKTEHMKRIRIGLFRRSLPEEVAMMVLMNKGPSVPQIIKLLDWYETPQDYILVLEHPTPCKDMRQFLQRNRGKIRESAARVVMHQAVTAAIICCQRGVFHSDIKLENLLINPNTLQVKLIDFGTSRRLKKSGYKIFSGTRSYAPPECFLQDRHYGESTTVYSLGVLLFRMVCGHFPLNLLPQIFDKTWSTGELSKECRNLIFSCMESEIAERIPLEEILLHDWFQID